MTAVPDRLLVWAIVGSQFGPPFLFAGVAVALPDLGAELHASAIGLALVETVFLVGSTAMLLPAGRLADAGDRRALFRRGLLVFAAASLALALAGSLWLVLVLRAIQGCAAGVFSATGTALLLDLVPPGRRGRALGAAMGVAYAGLSLGPLVAGALVAVGGWRLVFVCGGVVLGGCYGVLRWRLPAVWRWPARALNWPSTVLGFAVVAAATVGSSLPGTVTGNLGLVLAAAGTVVFVLAQRGLSRPLLDVGELWGNAPLRAALLVQALLYVQAYCSSFLMGVTLQVVQRLSPSGAGLVLAAGSAVMTIVAPLAGRAADRVSPRRLAALGIVAVVASAAVGSGLGPDSGLVRPLGLVMLQGLGFGLFSSPNMAVIMSSLPRERAGAASALASLARAIGMMVGMSGTGAVLALRLGSSTPAAEPEHFVAAVAVVFRAIAFTGAAALALALANEVLRRR